MSLAASEGDSDWAASLTVGDTWPGLKAEDHRSQAWVPEVGKAHLYVFSRSVVW